MSDRLDHVCPRCHSGRDLMSLALVSYVDRAYCEPIMGGEYIAGVEIPAAIGPHYCDDCGEFVRPVELEECSSCSGGGRDVQPVGIVDRDMGPCRPCEGSGRVT